MAEPPLAAAVDDLKRTSVDELVVQPRRRGHAAPSCPRCSAHGWWNGWRVVRPVMASASGVVRWELFLARVRCSSCRHAFTCYPPGFYPRRQYQLDVVAEAVATVEIGGKSVATAAAAWSASSTSVRRWSAWIATLAAVGVLHAIAAQVDPSSAPVATATPPSHAASMLAALEVLGAALVRVGVAVVERTGLGRVLGWQHRAHGVALGLVAGPMRFSPAMAPGGRPHGR